MKIGALLVILFIICLIPCSKSRPGKGKSPGPPPLPPRPPNLTRPPKTTRPPKVNHIVSPHLERKDSGQHEINTVINYPRPYDRNVEIFLEDDEIKEKSSEVQFTTDDNNKSGKKMFNIRIQ
ncbi:uncharacterized protein LOC111616488 [Centruroides sculpturatus]|uniref:uncharacterized protein LOC111616488 n=1 Tax=Centruroides sculpturatus TaxID=218467 RepID=UPI000C6E790D|nr:uncharacterized protein LOC111616488 [Centruroides sculpturatus]